MNRRDFLTQAFSCTGAVALTSAGLLLPDDAYAIVNQNEFWSRSRFIECRRADTGERSKIHFYQQNQGYQADAYKAACWLLRDAKDNNAMIGVDITLLNLLYAMQEWARMSGRPDPIITINSAYRTARRNATIEGAARNSLHVAGKAVDITMRGVTLSQLEQMARFYNVGGIGIYSTFIHLDTGRVRTWRG